MSNEPKEHFNVTADDLRHYPWEARIAASKRPEILSYLGPLSSGMDACKVAGDDLGCRVFSLLYTLASFRPDYDSGGNDYRPMVTHPDGSHSWNLEDLTQGDLTALAGIVTEIQDPEYRSRVADVLWLTKRDFRFKAAKLAISAYLESAARLKTEDLWPPYAERLDRAARIAAIRGFESEKATVVSTLEAAVDEFESKPKSGLLCHRLMSIISYLDEADRANYAALAERLALQFNKASNWNFAEFYWQLAAQWHSRSKSEADAQRCQIEAAECNITKAEARQQGGGGAMFSATWMGKGLEALRRAKAPKTRIQAVHQRLLKVQEQIPAEMKTSELKFDEVPSFQKSEAMVQEASRKHVRGVDLRTALERFTNIACPTNFLELKERHAETSRTDIFSFLVSSASIDRAGKTTDILPPLGIGTPVEQDEAQLKSLYEQARNIQWQMPVVWRIEPARQVIMEEHAMRRSDLMFLVLNNPFIPQGHEGIYLRGIQAGFHGDWLAAMHFLIPQLENSIRDILHKAGAITSVMRDGVQADKDLKQLFELQEFEQVFGPDLLFDLRGILVARFGHNLRNELAHGLLPEGGFYQAASVYLWWLAIHLCWFGFRLGQKPTDLEPNPPG